VRIYSRENEKVTGIRVNLEEILNQKRRYPRLFIETKLKISVFLLMLSLILVTANYTEVDGKAEVIPESTVIIIAVIMTIMTILISELLGNLNSIIFLKEFRPAENFLERNSDQIIVAIISSVLGVILGGLLSILFIK